MTKKPGDDFGFETRAIHAGSLPDPVTGARNVPVYQTTSYVFHDVDHAASLFNLQTFGYIYSRIGNPTVAALEERVASLEGGRGAVACASGMAATTMALDLVESGGRVVATRDSYGGTYRLFEQVLKRRGLDFTWVDTSDTEATLRALDDGAQMLFLEIPTNPMLRVLDLPVLAAAARAAGALTVVDNTFLSPYFLRPIEHGADVVVHSSTKYLNGHSDGVGGILVAADEDVLARCRFLQNAAGAVLSPFECWLLLRSARTLALRMDRHASNAGEIAARLRDHSAVAAVHYPGLPDHPGHERARRQMTGFGGMVSFDVETMGRARRVMEALRVFTIAESLGGVESLANHPATMTHASMPEPIRREIGIGDGLIRLSVGVEDGSDLVGDLDQALARLP